MKIQINATGAVVDEPLNKAQRLINKGIAHVAKEEIKPIEPIIKTAEDAKEFVKTIMEYPEKTEESIIFREPEVKEVDVIEPIPMDHYVDFDEPKEVKTIKKAKKKGK